MVILVIIGKVFITIIKIVLWLLFFAVLLLGLLLLVPVRYRIVWEKEESGANAFLLHGFFRWCLFVVRVPFSVVDGRTDYKIRIFGIDVTKLRQYVRQRRRDKKEKALRRKEKKAASEADGEKIPDAPVSAEAGKGMPQAGQEKGKKGTEAQSTAAKAADGGDGREKQTVLEWVKAAFRKMGEKGGEFAGRIRKFWRWLEELPKRWHGWRKRGTDMLELLREDFTRESICVIWENVVHLWSGLKPRTLTGRIRFGLADPCRTGQLLGLFAVLMGISGIYIDLAPEFEEKVFEGFVKMEGRIQIITLVSIIIKLYLDDNLKQLRKYGKAF